MSISMAKNRIRALPLLTAVARRLCTVAPAAVGKAAKQEKLLYRRLSALRADPCGRVAATMEGWMKEGNWVMESKVLGYVRQLRRYKDFKHALELIDWMEKSNMHITVTVHALRLDLISKVKGIDMAEDYFSNLPQSAKNVKTYGALFAGYCQEKMVDKALALYEKMKELNLTSTVLVRNNLMTLYMKLGQPEKVIAHFQELRAANISPELHMAS